MRDLLSWNLSLGRWAGVQVRLHVFFLLFVVLAIHFSMEDKDLLGQMLVSIGVLFLSVLAHEFGHCYAAWKVGGTADQVLIWPLGGLAQVNVSHEPFNELATSLAGPLVNFAVCLLTLPLLLLLGAEGGLLRLINPFSPPPAVQDSAWWANAVGLVFWINWMLLVVNVLPAYPLDGGRVLRSLLWFRHGYRTSVVVVARVAMVTAVGLCVLPWLIR
ncbi:MAG: site-2 protease family protein, partial [Pirellulales bacterium]